MPEKSRRHPTHLWGLGAVTMQCLPTLQMFSDALGCNFLVMYAIVEYPECTDTSDLIV